MLSEGECELDIVSVMKANGRLIRISGSREENGEWRVESEEVWRVIRERRREANGSCKRSVRE